LNINTYSGLLPWWEDIARRLLRLKKILALGIGKENSHLTLRVAGEAEPLTPEQLLRVIPTGSLELSASPKSEKWASV
jgi:hypothetical protein